MPLPLVRVQHDWYETSRGKNFWVNVITDVESVYGSATMLDGKVVVASKAVERIETGSPFGSSPLEISCGSSFDWTVRPPRRKFKQMEGRAMHSMDVSSDGSLRIQAHVDGYVGVFQTGEGEERVRRELNAHAGDAYVSRFFPSGRVALTAGMDTTVRIWDLVVDFDGETQACTATLSGEHKQAVLTSEVVGRGHGVVSGSRDSVAVVWDIAAQKASVRLDLGAGAINSVRVLASAAEPGVVAHGCALLGCESGTARLVDLSCGKDIISMDADAAVNACASFDSDRVVAIGTHLGMVSTWDLRSPASPLSRFRASKGGPITAFCEVKEKLAIATHDAVSIHDISSAPCAHTTLLSCSDLPTYAISAHADTLYTGGMDGIIYVFY